MPNQANTLNWTTYFHGENKPFFQRLLSFYRKAFISRAVKYYTDKYFPGEGIFLEAGAGTSQSSSRIEKLGRKLIALDLNHYVLAQHNCLDYKVQGDILSLPVRSRSVHGLWNLGVMEHFTDVEIKVILKEFKRILKDDGVLLLFWPPFYAPFQIVLNSIAWLSHKFFNKKIEFFPSEINRYQNKQRLINFLQTADLKLVKTYFNILDLFSYVVVIVKK